MDLNTIKAITIPEGSVKLITDSNGKVMWYNTAYRQLEYIHFNGEEYIQSLVGQKSGYYRHLEFDLERNDVRQSTFCAYEGTLNTAFRRFYLLDFDPANGVRASCGGTWSTAVAMSNIPLNTKLAINVVNSTVSSKPRMIFNLQNMSTGTNIIANTTLNGSSNGTLTGVEPYIMACHTINTDRDVPENPAKGKVYYFEERVTDYQGRLLHSLIPAQRKSDNVCGLYDKITTQFIPMQGVTITNAAAGPIINENVPIWINDATSDTWNSSTDITLQLPSTGILKFRCIAHSTAGPSNSPRTRNTLKVLGVTQKEVVHTAFDENVNFSIDLSTITSTTSLISLISLADPSAYESDSTSIGVRINTSNQMIITGGSSDVSASTPSGAVSCTDIYMYVIQ